MEYYTNDYVITSRKEIEQAVAERRAVIRWSHGNWENVARLLIEATPEEAAMEAERDTTGKCYSMGDETWSELATEPERALRAAANLLRVS